MIHEIPRSQNQTILLIILQKPAPLTSRLPGPAIYQIKLDRILFISEIHIIAIQEMIFIKQPRRPHILLRCRDTSHKLSVKSVAGH